jgi:hypothetical protein
LWPIDPLLGNDRETNDTTTIVRQQLRKYVTVLEPLLNSGLRATMVILLKRCFLCGPLLGYITRPTELSSVRYKRPILGGGQAYDRSSD